MAELSLWDVQNRLYADQDGLCAICHKAETDTHQGRRKSLSLDHCHDTGAIRGLLCGRCNRGLGMFLDSPEFLQAAAHYLENHADYQPLRWPSGTINGLTDRYLTPGSHIQLALDDPPTPRPSTQRHIVRAVEAAAKAQQNQAS